MTFVEHCIAALKWLEEKGYEQSVDGAIFDEHGRKVHACYMLGHYMQDQERKEEHGVQSKNKA